MEYAFIAFIAFGIILAATCWGMAYGWQRGWEEARGYYWNQYLSRKGEEDG